MTSILFNGCSFTKGTGLTDENLDPKLWTNQLAHNVFDNPVITNLSEAGRNNHWIFIETMSELLSNTYDVVIVGWTGTNRLNFNIGLELYNTLSRLSTNDTLDINLSSSQTISAKWLAGIGESIQKVQNPHWGILDLIKYINILHNYQVTQRKSKIFFVNSLCHWSNDYFTLMDYTRPSELGDFYNEVLEIDNRDDAEIKQLYTMIHQQYSTYGGIQSNQWLNLYDSLFNKKIDCALDGIHPGYASQDLYTDYLTCQLKNKLNLI
jgi:hypothetical protein